MSVHRREHLGFSITARIAQNINIVIKKKLVMETHELRTASKVTIFFNVPRGGFPISSYITKVSWKMFYLHLHITRRDVWGHVTRCENGALPLNSEMELFFFLER